jgi:signal transduction histidine kinase
MSSEFIREQLFKPFRSTKSTGMGIGAYESQQYVSELGGRIAVESTVGVGTRMKVILPARSRDIASDESRAEAA